MGFIKKFFCRKKNEAEVIGIIGADGPTAVWVKQKASNTENEAFLEYAATKIKPNAHDFCELEEYLIKNYNAEPYILSEKEQQVLKTNVIVNHFRNLLDLPGPLSPNPTKKQILEYAQNDTSFEQARKYPAEKLGLIMKAYKMKTTSQRDTIVKLEVTTQYMCIDDASEKLANELILWLGVTQNDIDDKTPRFLAYAYTLKKAGKIEYGI